MALWLNRNFNGVKHRAKRTNIIFSITKENLKESLYENDKSCIYCGKELNFNSTLTDKMDTPSIDRIVPEYGYIENNIIIACYRCNSIKRDATYEELINIGNVLKKLIEVK